MATRRKKPQLPEKTESPEGGETPESKVFSSADIPMVAAVGVRKVDPNMSATEKKLKDLGLIP